MDGHDPLLLTLLLLALVLAVTMAALGWAVLDRQRLAGRLHEARSQLAILQELLDAWQWQTDAAHRLVAVHAPRDAAAGAWPAAQPGAALSEVFESVDPAALRQRMASAAAIDDSPGRRAGAPAGRTALLRGRACRDRLGAFAGYVGTLRDVAEPAAAPAAEITTLAAAGSAAPRSPAPAPAAPSPDAEHESFSYTVSHDLRAPIRVVEGFTKIVKEDYGRLIDRVGNDHLDRVLGAAARMNSMIDALLALSKLSSQPLARQPVNLSQLATYVTDDLRRQRPDRRVTVEIEPALLVHGDPTLLRVVLENLLGNAWKYSGKCEDARVWFGRRPQDADTFTVRDNGAGFDMRYADRLFGVFQRLHSAGDFPGTGVGLATVRRIVQRHGGSIWGEGEVNRGAQFHFTLPQDGGAGSRSTTH